MARPYATDLRERVAALFEVGESTLYRWRQAWRTEGRREPRSHAGGPAPRLDGAALDRLKELVAEGNDRALAEYAAGLRERAGVKASGPTVCRALKKLGLSRKKTLRAAEQDRPELVQARAAWRAGLARVDPRRLVFLDESGIDTRMTRAPQVCFGARFPVLVRIGRSAPTSIPLCQLPAKLNMASLARAAHRPSMHRCIAGALFARASLVHVALPSLPCSISGARSDARSDECATLHRVS